MDDNTLVAMALILLPVACIACFIAGATVALRIRSGRPLVTKKVKEGTAAWSPILGEPKDPSKRYTP